MRLCFLASESSQMRALMDVQKKWRSTGLEASRALAYDAQRDERHVTMSH